MNLVPFKSSLPATTDRKQLALARQANLQNSVSGSTPLLKMDKTGTWVFGKDGTPVQENSKWAVHPESFLHGWICWGGGERKGEKMAPMQDPMPEAGPVPLGGEDWGQQFGVTLQCVSGEDKGTVVSFRSSSYGGSQAVKELCAAVDQQMIAGLPEVALVTLETGSYMHREYGRIFTPTFKVREWVPFDGPTPEAEPEPEVEPVVAAVPKRRRPAAE